MSVQTISLLLELKDKISAELGRVDAELGKLRGGAGATQGAFSGFGLVGIGAVAGIGAAAYKAIEAVGALAQEGIDLNRQFENTSIRIAGTLKAFDVAPSFAAAKAQAAGVMETVAELAAKLPGETEDYVSVFATALPKAISAGMTDMQDVAKFTSYWTAVATSNMVDAQQAGMDLFRVLSGQAGADVRMFTVLAEKIGMTAESFNKLSAPERLAKIQEAIGAFDSQLIAAGDSFDAKAGEFESRLKEIKRVGAELSFDLAKKSLDEMNARLKDNSQELKTATASLTGAFTFYKDASKGLLTDLAIGAAKLLNTLTESNQELANMRSQQEAMSAIDPLAARAAAQEADTDAREARRALYKERGFEEITKMLPLKMAAPLGPSGGVITPKVYEELLKIGKARKTDVTFVNKLSDYLEFMGGIDPDLFYYKVRGIRPEGMKKEKLATGKAPNFDFRNSRFDIKQQFAEGFDPDRIAVAFASDITSMGEMKVQSGYTTTATVR